MKKSIWLFLAVLLMLSACSNKHPQSAQPFLVTTTGMIGDLVRNIAGPSYRVESLMGPGVDPHLFKASQSDIAKLATAEIIFYNGLHLEGKMSEIFEKMMHRKKVVSLSSVLADTLLIALDDSRQTFDPHIWFDVSLWRRTIPAIARSLQETFPDDRDRFAAHAARMDSTLAALHQWVLAEVAQVPQERRIMITAHDAFSYFGRAYHITVHGLQGVSTVAEYGLNDINKMVDLIVERRIRAVFIETSIPRRSIEAVVAGVAARGGDIRIGGSLYSDAMGGPGSGAETYAGMVRTNVRTIVDALK